MGDCTPIVLDRMIIDQQRVYSERLALREVLHPRILHRLGGCLCEYKKMFRPSNPREVRKPLTEPPPGSGTLPILMLGLDPWILEKFTKILHSDLVYRSTWQADMPMESKVEILKKLEVKDLVEMNQAFGGTVAIPGSDMYTRDGDFVETSLQSLEGKSFQAIVVDDTDILNERVVQEFVKRHYEENNTSVVILSIEGVFNISPLNSLFGVSWRSTSYTKESLMLTPAGERLLKRAAFPEIRKYTKALFVQSSNVDEHLFVQYVDPEDYEEEIPDPIPGSPVVCHIDGDRAVSYFGFVNSLDIDYGSVILRLCYAAQHAASGN